MNWTAKCWHPVSDFFIRFENKFVDLVVEKHFVSVLDVGLSHIVHMNPSAALFKDSVFSSSKFVLRKDGNSYAMVSHSRLVFLYLSASTAAVIPNMKSGQHNYDHRLGRLRRFKRVPAFHNFIYERMTLL